MRSDMVDKDQRRASGLAQGLPCGQAEDKVLYKNDCQADDPQGTIVDIFSQLALSDSDVMEQIGNEMARSEEEGVDGNMFLDDG